MNAVLTRIKEEPAMVGAFVTGVLAVLVTLGVPMTPEQQTAILALVPLIVGFVVRSNVTPVSKLPDVDPSDAVES